jgi:predicted AAA+ superfamily ATPase
MLKFEIYPLSFEEFLRFKEKNELANAIGKQDIPQYIEVQIKEYFKEYLRF